MPRPSCALVFGVFLVLLTLSLGIGCTTGLKITIEHLLFVVFGIGGMIGIVAFFARQFFNDVNERVHPEKPKVASEQSLFSPLVDFAEATGGVFEVSGRAGKARIVEGSFEYSLTVRKSTMQGPQNAVLMNVAAPLSSTDFKLELSAQPIRRKDLDEFPSGNESLDAKFSMASNDVERAIAAIESIGEELNGLGKEVSISTRRGAIEMKTLLADFNQHNIVQVFEIFKKLHGSVSGELNSSAKQV